MATKNFFQVSSVCNTGRAGGALMQSHQHPSLILSSRESLNLQRRNHGLPACCSTLSFSSPRPSYSAHSRVSTIVCQAREAVDVVKEVSEKNWGSLVVGSQKPVLVEFWAPWCGPCRMIAPVVEELAKDYAGKIECYKLNTDESPNVATQFGIRSIPTVVFFKNGEKKESVIGAVPKSTLSTAVEKYLDV